MKTDGKLSYYLCNMGIKRGENPNPFFFFFFFVIFLNDFEYSIDQKYSGLNLPLVGDINVCVSDDNVEHFLKIYILLYAENTIAFAEYADELQLALNVVHDYCNN